MEYPGDPTKLTKEQIIQHYSRTGLKPCRKPTMNAMIREQYLQLRETHAFFEDLVERGVFEDDGGAELLRSAYTTLEGYIDKLNAYGYT